MKKLKHIFIMGVFLINLSRAFAAGDEPSTAHCSSTGDTKENVTKSPIARIPWLFPW